MIFTKPFWLIFLIPLLLFCWHLFRQRKCKTSTAVMFLLLLIAIASPMLKKSTYKGTVVAVVDQSLSMPIGSQEHSAEIIELLEQSMPSGWKFAVLSYGLENVVEKTTDSDAFSGFVAQVNKHHSNLSDALVTAGQLIGNSTSGRVVVISDGIWTGKDPVGTARLLASKGIAVDYRSLQNKETLNDVQVTTINAPVNAYPGEVINLTADIHSPLTQEISYTVVRNDKIIVQQSRKLIAGINRIQWFDKVKRSGCVSYALEVKPSLPDSIVANNKARVLVGVKGQKPLLLLSGNSNSSFTTLLQKAGLNVVTRNPKNTLLTLEKLASFSGVILENVPAQDIGEPGMSNLAAWVRSQGGGLFITGGKHSLGVGGYYKSSLEPALPVSLELRQEHRKLSMAMVVTLDRSGSMGMRTPCGRTKMELASMATAQVFDMLSGSDELGVIAVDSAPHDIVPLAKRSTLAPSTRSKIISMNSQGGGIYVYEALWAASHMLINRSTAGTKHIILFSDSQDSEKPGNYKKLLEKCTASGITCSVIALGKPTDSDAELLRDVAKCGKGRIFFTENATDLPRLFAQDTMVVARNTFIEEPVSVKCNPLLRTIGNINIKAFTLGGYNLCYIKPGATQAAVTTDEYKAPVLSYWQFGTGRVICFAGEVNGKFTGPFKEHPQAGNLLTSIARWTAGKDQLLGDSMALRQTLENGSQRISLYVAPEFNQFTSKPKIISLAGKTGTTPVINEYEMDWVEPDKLEIVIPINPEDTVLTTINIPTMESVTLSPVCLPSSPEYRHSQRNGKMELRKIATITGGEELLNVATIWSKLPAREKWTNVSPWLLTIVVTIFVLTIFSRRTGKSFRFPKIDIQGFTKKSVKKTKKLKRSIKEVSKSETFVPEAVSIGESAESGVVSALSEAKRKRRNKLK